jgi:hypothetical protein
MSKYATVEEGVITGWYEEVPSSFGNISGFNYLTNAERLAYNFYKIVNSTKPEVDEYQSLEVSYIYDSLTDKVNEVWTVTDDALLEAKEKKWARIQEKRDACFEGGVKRGGLWYQTDVASRIRWLAFAGMKANLPADINWRTMDGTLILLTQTLVGNIVDDINAKDIAAINNAEALKVLVDASPAPKSVDITTGWPNNY